MAGAPELMAVCGPEGGVRKDVAKLFDFLQGQEEKGALPSKAWSTIPPAGGTESVFQFGQSLEHLEQAFLQLDAGLDAFDDDGGRVFCHGQ